MSIIKHAVITAAGLGSRLGMNLPKCLVPVADKRIIEYQLELLKEVEDIRIVVGFMKEEVIKHVKAIRPDAIFVLNHQYATTTTLQSLYLGARDLKQPFLVLDGDVIPEETSFKNFIAQCQNYVPLTTICASASTDAVFAITKKELEQDFYTINKFQREPATNWEWPGISYIHPDMLSDHQTFVYQQLEKYLPLNACVIKCWEVDTPEDLTRANHELRHTK